MMPKCENVQKNIKTKSRLICFKKLNTCCKHYWHIFELYIIKLKHFYSRTGLSGQKIGIKGQKSQKWLLCPYEAYLAAEMDLK